MVQPIRKSAGYTIYKGELIIMFQNKNKDRAKACLQEYLEEQHGINTSKPFRCLNPDHDDRNPSMAFDRTNNRCVCFACGARYDIFDLVGIDHQLTDTVSKFRKTYQLLGIHIERGRSG